MKLEWFESYNAGDSEQTSLRDDCEYMLYRRADGNWDSIVVVSIPLGIFKTEKSAKKAAQRHADQQD